MSEYVAHIRGVIEGYCDAVISGEQVVGRWVKLAVERHLHDLRHGHERGLYFDWTAAAHVILFASLCVHYQGRYAGQRFTPEPWQYFFLGVLFGWKRADGTRRYRRAYLEIARKNGKTFLAAIVALYMLAADRESGAEVYSVATKKDQAKKCHGDAVGIIRMSTAIKGVYRVMKDNITHDKSMSFFRPLGKDSNTLDGLNIHLAIADELHAWRDRLLWDVIKTSFGARSQYLLLAITTAGYDRATTCWDQHTYSRMVLAAQDAAGKPFQDDEFFCMIFAVDDESEINDESAWEKANPCIDVAIDRATIKKEVEEALALPSQMNNVLRLRFNFWTQAEFRWLRPVDWAGCADTFEEIELYGRDCYAGLDLSKSNDISSLVYVFPPVEEGEKYKVVCRCWCPEEKVKTRSQRDNVPYEVFVRSGELVPTPGKVVDYDHISNRIRSDSEVFSILELRYDPWHATRIIQEVDDMGMTVVKHSQGFESMSAPCINLERLVMSGMLAHCGNAILTWMSQNVVVIYDSNGNIRPDKAKSKEKIDGIVALIMAVAGVELDSGGSPYDNFPMDYA